MERQKIILLIALAQQATPDHGGFNTKYRFNNINQPKRPKNS